MNISQRSSRSAWDEAYCDIQVTASDVEFALVIIGIFAAIAMIA